MLFVRTTHRRFQLAVSGGILHFDPMAGGCSVTDKAKPSVPNDAFKTCTSMLIACRHKLAAAVGVSAASFDDSPSRLDQRVR
jgi:hypothetical protein